jgi:hypothetical protein
MNAYCGAWIGARQSGGARLIGPGDYLVFWKTGGSAYQRSRRGDV